MALIDCFNAVANGCLADLWPMCCCNHTLDASFPDKQPAENCTTVPFLDILMLISHTSIIKHGIVLALGTTAIICTNTHTRTRL